MNLKSNILKIGVVIALIFMLIPVIAAEDVDDSAYAESVDQTDVISEDISEADDELTADSQDDSVSAEDDETDENANLELTATEEQDIAAGAGAAYGGDQSADLQITVINPNEQLQVGDIAKLGILVYNNGPDKSYNILVRSVLLSGAMDIYNFIPSQGEVYMENGTVYWIVGDLEAGQFAFLGIIGQVITNEDVIMLATVVSETPDPDLSNNFAFGIIDIVSAEESADVMPATGNPISLAILALLSVVGVSLRRKS